MYDYTIVGAGMAGASLAAELASLSKDELRIALLEAEESPGYHATGRSAAFWEECYGGPDIVPLTLASGAYLREYGFLRPRGALYIGREEDEPAIAAFAERFKPTGASFERIPAGALHKRLPHLRRAWDRAIWQPDCADIDVGTLHQHYLQRASASGVVLRTRFRVDHVSFAGSDWTLASERGERITARYFVNAAGAWADDLAALAGLRPKNIGPLRRTVVQLRTAPSLPGNAPLTLDINGQFYFKPDGDRLWLSPHDETPSAPCDAAPEEYDVALAIDRLAQVLDVTIEAVERKWAGLRSFSSDRLPVYGADPHHPQFVWFAGQGGYGIQTAPAAARLLAQRLLDQPPDAMTAGLRFDRYAAERFDH